jgi:ubiquinone/menaquinone biosynthesis C-methylase UbiE
MNTINQQISSYLEEKPRDHHTCPYWVGYLIANPIRKLRENPETLMGPWVGPGAKAVDIGPAMGFFSLPLAQMVGDSGRVLCVDIQERMLKKLEKRARRKKLDHIIETRGCTQEDLGLGDLNGTIDFALAVHVVHEVAYPRRLLTGIYELLRPGGKLLVMEPKGHVTVQDFEATRDLAKNVGFKDVKQQKLKKSHYLVLEHPEATS